MDGLLAHWRRLPERHRYYICYTLAFAVTALLVFALFIVKGRSFAWIVDGLYQHFNAFMYYGEWLRGVAASIVAGKPEIPMYEFAIAYGEDVVTTLAYYVIGDPFALVSIFFPKEFTEVGYAVSILLRYFAVGIAFSVFARKMGCGNFATLCGSLVYAFSAFALYAGVKHPYFLDPMIWMPLIFFGLEKVLAKESPIPYILFVFLMTVSNFYFLYMVLLITVVYGLCRVLLPPFERSPRQTVTIILKLVLYSLIGICLGFALLLPVVMAFLSNTRVSGAYQFEPFYSSYFYRMFFGCLVSCEVTASWSFVGMAPICWLGVIAFFAKRNEQTLQPKVYFLILLVMLLIPFVGYVMNGMGYVTNRWSFAWSFWAAFLFAKGLPALLDASRKEKTIVSVGCILIVLAALWGVVGSPFRNMLIVCGGCIVLLACLIPLWIVPRIKRLNIGSSTFAKERVVRCGYVLTVVICVVWMSVSLYWSYTGEFARSGDTVSRLENPLASQADYIDATAFYRADRDASLSKVHNLPLTSGVGSPTFYWSLVNPNVTSFLDRNSAFAERSYWTKGMTARSFLLPLVSSRYYLGSPEEMSIVPYGFEKINSNNESVLYESQYALPFGYTYDSFISEEDAQSLSVVQRQQAMLQGAIVEDASLCGDLKALAPDYSDMRLAYEIESGEEVEIHDDRIIVQGADANLALSFQCPSDCELYVQLNGLEYSGAAERVKVTARTDAVSAYILQYEPQSIYANGRRDFLINLGYSDEKRTSLTLTFSAAGTYTFDDLSIICQPMDGFEERIDALREDTLEDVVFETNKVSGRIELEEPKLLCLSLPYADGWSATVDGQPAETLRTNTMFTGIMLPAGDHEVVLTYETPYIRLGLTVSALALLVTILIGVCWHRKKRNVESRKAAAVSDAYHERAHTGVVEDAHEKDE